MKYIYIYSAVFLLLSAAVFFILRPDKAILQSARKQLARKSKARPFKKRNKLWRRLARQKEKICRIIVSSNMPLAYCCVLSALSAAGGFILGKMVFSSTAIAMAVGAAGLSAPLLFFSFRQTKAGSIRLERLLSSMMILSNSYVVTEDFISSVRDNIGALDYPEPFKAFLSYVTLVDSDVKSGLRRLAGQVDNAYFSQWIDAIILAQDDRSLKYVCVSVVDSMHDALQAQIESDAAMHTVWRDYLMTLTLIFSVPLVFRFTLPDAYETLTSSVIGQSLFALLLAAVIYSVLRAVKINRPLMM